MLSISVLGTELYDNDPNYEVILPEWPGEWKRVRGPRFSAPAFSVSGKAEELESFLDEWRWTCPESNVHMHIFRCYVRGLLGENWELCLQFALVNWPHREADKFGPLPRIGLVARLAIKSACEALYEKHVAAEPV